MSNFAIRFSSDAPIGCAISSAMVYDGYYLLDDSGSRFVSVSVYEQQFKNAYPQLKKVLALEKGVAERIIEAKKGVLPVGYLIGRQVTPLGGEDMRFECVDCIISAVNHGKYEIPAEDKNKYHSANLSGKILGMFLCNRSLKECNLERALKGTLRKGAIFLVIQNCAVGGQRAEITGEQTEIGVVII